MEYPQSLLNSFIITRGDKSLPLVLTSFNADGTVKVERPTSLFIHCGFPSNNLISSDPHMGPKGLLNSIRVVSCRMLVSPHLTGLAYEAIEYIPLKNNAGVILGF